MYDDWILEVQAGWLEIRWLRWLIVNHQLIIDWLLILVDCSVGLLASFSMRSSDPSRSLLNWYDGWHFSMHQSSKLQFRIQSRFKSNPYFKPFKISNTFKPQINPYPNLDFKPNPKSSLQSIQSLSQDLRKLKINPYFNHSNLN